MNGSRLSSRPDHSWPEMTWFVFVPPVICNNGSSEQKWETHVSYQENRHILHCLFRFKLTFWSRLVLGCCKTCAEAWTKSSSAINRVVWKRCYGDGWSGVETKFPALSCSRSFSRHCSACLSALKVWGVIENRAWAAIVRGFSKPQTTFECIYTSTFTYKVSSGLDKPSPKLLGQDKPRLEQAVGWMSRGRRFCNIYAA